MAGTADREFLEQEKSRNTFPLKPQRQAHIKKIFFVISAILSSYLALFLHYYLSDQTSYLRIILLRIKLSEQAKTSRTIYNNLKLCL